MSSRCFWGCRMPRGPGSIIWAGSAFYKVTLSCRGTLRPFGRWSTRLGTSQVAQWVKNLPAVQEMHFDPWVRKIPWRRDGNPLQYSCLKNPMGRGASQATVHWVTESDITELAEQTGMFSSVQSLSMYLYLYLVLFTLISPYLCLYVSLSLTLPFFLLCFSFSCMSLAVCVCTIFFLKHLSII